ncbi:MAG TPA: alpha/beta fold hydrolase [Gemmata sp.]
MPAAVLVLSFITAGNPVSEPQTELWQVAPDTCQKPWVVPEKPSEKTRAVVLLHGLYLHPLRPAKATQPWMRPWQLPKSGLVKTLAAEFDVFALGYSQVVSVDETAEAPGLRTAVEQLRKAGYTDVVLVGHSAGGLIAKRFVEVCPNAGVTRVITVAAPYVGVEAANLGLGYRKVQAPFVESLTPSARIGATKANKFPLGNEIEIVCVVCKLKHLETDGLVKVRSQWPEELQQRGVPAVLTLVNHFEVMDDADTAKTILKLAKGKLTRWSPEEVEAARKVLFGEHTAHGAFFHRQAK